MKRMFVLLLSGCLVAGCTQMTTNAAEREVLLQAANQEGNGYVACLTANGTEYVQARGVDVATAVKLAADRCAEQLEVYTVAQRAYLESEYMLTKKPLQAAVDVLTARAVQEVGLQLISTPAAAVYTTQAADWNAQQRSYLDCMDDQAHQYATLNEAANVIADVAHSRCKSQLGGGPDAAALEAEGRAQAMGIVLDAKLAQPAG